MLETKFKRCHIHQNSVANIHKSSPTLSHQHHCHHIDPKTKSIALTDSPWTIRCFNLNPFSVGAGSAGCVVANRLAADSSKTGRFHNMMITKISPYSIQFYLSNQDQIQSQIFFEPQPWSESRIQRNDFLPGKIF